MRVWWREVWMKFQTLSMNSMSEKGVPKGEVFNPPVGTGDPVKRRDAAIERRKKIDEIIQKEGVAVGNTYGWDEKSRIGRLITCHGTISGIDESIGVLFVDIVNTLTNRPIEYGRSMSMFLPQFKKENIISSDEDE
jgi:hypothetical protein